MKHLLLAAGLLATLASCGTKDSDPTHAAVTAYLQKNLDDPASYQSVRWGKTKSFEQRSLDIDKAADLLQEYQHQHELAMERSQHFIDMADLASTPAQGLAELDKAKKALALYNQRADSVKKLSDKFRDSTDSTELGKLVVHTYRAKNKMGALQLDSAAFTVLKTGKVEMQRL